MEPIEKYKEKLEKLENYLDFAIDVSNATGGHFVPWKLVRSNQLFIRMTVTCTSFIRLLPFNHMFPTKYEFWDLFSVFSLARNFVETYLMLWYIGVDNISDDECKLRLEILNYHLNSEKYKLYKEFGTDAESLKDFEQMLPKIKEEISNNPLFSHLVLDKNKRKQILNGTEAKYLSNHEIIDKADFVAYEFKPFYRFFSNHTHSMPFAVFSLNDERGSGKRNRTEVQYFDMALDFVTKYLLIAMIDTIKLFPFCEEKLNKEKLQIIRSEYILYSQNLPS